ncbi:3751_t:CDS:2 [Acaulospora morrowiae]|uniref:Endopolyphosphatase n=1 Tax=Acaulospora morrowiae TaxID=94023 RepID=A0A9N8W0L4_9GLOM|nr:3751_t:CDS:2 [Acaulospora morrowiae]
MLATAKLLILVVPVLIFLIFAEIYDFGLDSSLRPIEQPNELRGNFLHITDFHPDPHYVANSLVKTRCHGNVSSAKKPAHMTKGISGSWGASATICDSPMGLINATFEWLENNWKDKLDFIIWTGDNSRHDNDENMPRTPQELFGLNRMITSKFLQTFSSIRQPRRKPVPHFIPIVPSIGNHDIYPNNILLPGPNDILSTLYDIWAPFIPRNQRHTFLHGGYYYTEVIPKKLLVVSLNTMYFYNSNTAVNGCKEPGQPGTKELKWLNGVLKKARKDGMKVYLTGHVAPRHKQYTKSCYKKYGKLALKYHEVILGHYYGHSNMDHFFFIGANVIDKNRNNTNDEIILAKDDEDYDSYDDVYEDESPSKEDSYNDEPSVNISSESEIDKYLDKLLNHYQSVPPISEVVAEDYAVVHINPSIIPVFYPALRIIKYNTTETSKRKKKPKNHDPNSPSHSNTFLTPLGYTQYFINLTEANRYPNKTPVFEVEYTTWNDYRMKDLTVKSWIKLARDLADHGLKGSLWKKYRDHLMVGTRSLVKERNKKLVQNCIYSKCSAKGPGDYLITELDF